MRRTMIGLHDAICESARLKAWRNVKRFALSALVIACVLGAGAARAAGLVFSDGFESGTLSNSWTKDGIRSMCTVVEAARDGGAPHSGKNMLECNWNGTVAWDNPNAYSTVALPQKEWDYKSEFFIRLWLRYDNDVSHAQGGKVFRLFPSDPVVVDDFYMVAQMNYPGGPAIIKWGRLNGQEGPVFWGQGTSLGDHNWHKIEIYMKASTKPDGITKVWLDGILRQELTKIATVAPGHTWGPMHLMSNWSNQPDWQHGANNHVYWDDIEVYTDVGSGASGQMSDASISGGSAAPNAPSDIIVH